MTGADDIRLAVAALSDTGLRRAVNEDSYLAEHPVFAVADGMGGYEAGDRASAAVVTAFRTHVAGRALADVEAVRDALLAADDLVAAVAADTIRGAGSTVAGVALTDYDDAPHWLVFNVGDSRVYRFLDGALEQLTVDHSLGQELVDRGQLRRDELASFAGRNVITRAIGASDSMADSWLLPVVAGERLLVCSDGLHSEVDDDGIRALLAENADPADAAAALVARALDNGGRDNVTLIVLDVLAVDVPETTAPRPAWGAGLDVDLDDTVDTVPIGR